VVVWYRDTEPSERRVLMSDEKEQKKRERPPEHKMRQSVEANMLEALRASISVMTQATKAAVELVKAATVPK
jgi:hypothetical protein